MQAIEEFADHIVSTKCMSFIHFGKSIVRRSKHAELASTGVLLVSSLREKVFNLTGWESRLRRCPTGDVKRQELRKVAIQFVTFLYRKQRLVQQALAGSTYVNYLRKVRALAAFYQRKNGTC